MIRWYHALSLLLVACWAGAQPLQVGFIERPPYIYAMADGRVKGVFGQQLTRLFADSGVDAHLNRFYSKDVAGFLDIQGLDAFIATPILATGRDDLLSTREPLITLEFFAYFLPDQSRVSSIEQLRNTRVILPMPLEAMNGEVYHWFKDPANQVTVIHESPNLEQTIPFLRKGEADYIISYISPVSQQTMFSRALRANKVQHSEVFAVPMYLLIRRDVEGVEHILQRINTRLSIK